jgi:hypothetical protein
VNPGESALDERIEGIYPFVAPAGFIAQRMIAGKTKRFTPVMFFKHRRGKELKRS